MKKLIGVILIIVLVVGITLIKQLALIKKQINKVNNSNIESIVLNQSDSTENTSNQTWYINTQFGLVFETPKKLSETNIPMSPGRSKHIKEVYGYSLNNKEITINYLIMETNFIDYKPEDGLNGSISNVVNSLDGSDLSLEFYNTNNKYKDIGCKGTFIYKSTQMKVEGYCLFKKTGRIYILVALGENNEKNKTTIDRIFNSIKSE